MNEFEVWVYRGAIVILLAILWYLAKGVLKQLKEINGTLKFVQIHTAKTDKDVQAIQKEQLNHQGRLNNHADRIRELEINQEGCPVCKEAKRK
jgi:hypothetical protein